MFYDQLVKLCKSNTVSPTAITEKLGYSRGSLTNWKNGTTPNGDIIVCFSQYFHVSTDYFLLGKEEQAVVEVAGTTKDKLTFDEKSLINTYRELNDDGKTKMLDESRRIWADYPLLVEDNQLNNKSSYYPTNEKNVGNVG